MTDGDVVKLVVAKSSESQNLEFKRDRYPDAKERRVAKDEFLKDVVGMLNGGGGTILIGIEEQSGVASRIVNVVDATSESRRYEQWIATSVDPPAIGIGVTVRRIDGAEVISIQVPNGSDSAYSYMDDRKRLVFPLRVGTQTTQMSSAEIRRRLERGPSPSNLDVELESLQESFETTGKRFGASRLILVAESDSRKVGLTAQIAKGVIGDYPIRGFCSAMLREPRIATSLDSLESRNPSIDFGATRVRDTTGRVEVWRIPILRGSFILRAQEFSYQAELEPLAEAAMSLIRPAFSQCVPRLPPDMECRNMFAHGRPLAQWLTLLHAACWAGEIPSCRDVMRYWTCGGFSCPYDGERPADAIGFFHLPQLEELPEFKEIRASNRFTEQWTSEIRQNIFAVSAAFIRSIRRKLR